MLGGGVIAGVFGSLLGLGGGVLIVPLLTIGFGIPIREAVGVSLICVIMTSGASAAVFLERDVANLRLGMFLELFTSTGAIVGGAIAFLLDERFIAGLLAALMLYVALTMLRSATRGAQPVVAATETPTPASLEATSDPPDPPPDPPSTATGSGFVARLSRPGYTVSHLPFATAGSLVAGVLSALLGIGGGIIKVPIMQSRDGRAPPGSHRDEQPDDRHHGLGERHRVPAPRRDRAVRCRTDRGRRLHRGDDRLAHRPPRRRPGLAPAVRGGPALHRLRDGPPGHGPGMSAVPQGSGADHGLEGRVARVLTIGTLLAVGLLAIGSVLLIASGRSPLDVAPPFDPARCLADLATLQPVGFLWLGLVVVIATPAARVAAALVGYNRQGERAMALVAGLVLVVIALGVAIGLAGA